MDIAVFKQAQEAYAKGDYKSALAGFTVCTRDIGELSDAEIGKFYHLIGNCYIKNGQPVKAAEFYEKALSLASEERRPSLLVNLGTARLASGEHQEALDAFHAALECPGYATPYKAYSGIGSVYLKLKEMEEAGVAYRKAALDPSNPSPGKALINLGVCFMELNRSSDAISVYNTALDLGLSTTAQNKCLANLGQAYLAQGRVGEAVEAFEAATEDGTYALSEVAAHDLGMARTLKARFGDYLGTYVAPAPVEETISKQESQPEPIIEDEVHELESAEESEELSQNEELSFEDEQVFSEQEGVSDDSVYEQELDATESEEQELVDVANAQESSGEDQERTAEIQVVAEEPADESVTEEEVDSAAETQAFPVVVPPVRPDEDLQEEEPEENSDLDSVAAPLDNDLPTDAFKAMDEDEEALIPSPEDTAFFTIKEEDIEKAAQEERRKARKGHTGLKVALGIVIVLILLAAAAAFAYVRGYGWPLQEAVAKDFMAAAVSGESTDSYWNESVAKESRDAQVTKLQGVQSYEVIAVERSVTSSTVYLSTTLSEGGKAYYQIMMGRDLISWDVEYVELYFPSEQG